MHLRTSLGVVVLAAACTLMLLKQRIPEVVWTYWNDDALPEVVAYCTRGWARMNPGYDIRVITPSTLRRYATPPPYFKSLEPQRQSDWVRLNVLSEYGGIWADASIVATEPFDWVHTCQRRGGIAFYLEKFTSNAKFPVIESWFIASTPNNTFTVAWFEEFDRAIRRCRNDGDVYLKELEKRYGTKRYDELVQEIDAADYLTIHMAAQKVMQVDKVPPFALLKAEDGPYALLKESDWNDRGFVQLFTENRNGPPIPKMIKLRGEERNMVQRMIDEGGEDIDPGSLCRKHMMVDA